MCSQIFLCDLIIAVVDSLNYFSWWICLLLRGSLLLVLTQCSNSVTSKIYYGKMYFPFKINWLRWRKAAKILNKCAGKKMLLREQVNIWLKRNESAESNGSYFMMLAHDIRGGCWWDDSRGWIFLPISHYILLLCSKWQMRDSLTEWHLMWKCVWRKGVSLNSSMPKKKRCPLKFFDACWTFVETKQRMWAQWGRVVVTATWKTIHTPDSHVQLSHHKMKSVSTSSSADYNQETVYGAEYQLQCIRNNGGSVGI